MNGLVNALTWGAPRHDQWSKLAPPRAYSKFVQPQPFEAFAWRGKAPALPLRQLGAKTGSQIAKELLDTEPSHREQAIATEVLRGNVPDRWRQFVNVEMKVKDASGALHQVTLRVALDYLCVGSDADFLRIPLTPYTAQFIADVTGCVPPTRKMVDEFHRSATVKLSPAPLTKDRELLATFLQHHNLIQSQLKYSKASQFVSGIKKDVVISRKLSERPDRVAIYGWHQSNGEPIQPLSTVHVAHYVDYSHGVRLLDQWCEVDGRPRRVSDILGDAELHSLLSDEGRFETTVYHRSGKK
jgi:hypothetical protein